MSKDAQGEGAFVPVFHAKEMIHEADCDLDGMIKFPGRVLSTFQNQPIIPHEEVEVFPGSRSLEGVTVDGFE